MFHFAISIKFSPRPPILLPGASAALPYHTRSHTTHTLSPNSNSCVLRVLVLQLVPATRSNSIHEKEAMIMIKANPLLLCHSQTPADRHSATPGLDARSCCSRRSGSCCCMKSLTGLTESRRKRTRCCLIVVAADDEGRN